MTDKRYILMDVVVSACVSVVVVVSGCVSVVVVVSGCGC